MLEGELVGALLKSRAVLINVGFSFVSGSLNGLVRRAGAGANLMAEVVNTEGATGVVELERLGTTFRSVAAGTIADVYL